MAPFNSEARRQARDELPSQPHLDHTAFSMGPSSAPLACLLIHGFSGSPAEMRWLGSYLAARGVRVEGVRLAGHGTRPEQLSGLTWHDWLRTAEEGLARLLKSKRELGRKVVIVGFSMGGLLALQLCAAQPDDIAGLVTISSPIYFRDRRIHLIPVVRRVIRWHNVKHPSHNIDPEAHTRYASYRRYPLIAVDHLLDLMRVTRRLLPKVRVPALIMHGLQDGVVHPRSAPFILDHLGSERKELEWWHNSGHGVPFDAEREAVWRRILAFATSL